MAASVEQNGWVERVLSISLSGSQGGGQNAPHDRRAWKATRAAWDRASDEADGQIAALQQALREDDDPELREIGELGLNAVTGNFRVPLRAALVALDIAAEVPDERTAGAAASGERVREPPDL